MSKPSESTGETGAVRVLHLDDGREWRGGQHQVYLLMTELAKFEVAQRLLAPAGSPLAQRAEAAGLEVRSVRFGGEWNFLAARTIMREALDFRASVIHAHTGHAQTHALRAAHAVCRRGLAARLVVTRRVDFEIGANAWSRRKYLDPAVHYIAISTAVRDVLVRVGVDPNRIAVVASGVPPLEGAWPRDQVREALNIAPDELAIVNVGALTDHKGHRYLIEAAPAVLHTLPHARLHILGEGELRESLAEQIRAAGLGERVRLHGHVPDARLKLGGFDLFVSSSHLEGLGTAILDAMLAGLPVVAAAAGGVVDIVRHHETGRLVPVRDASALATALLEAIRRPADSIAMAREARARVERDFSARSMAEGTLRLGYDGK